MPAGMGIRILTLSTLFPDISRPNFGVFVERQTRELASRDGVDLTVVAPIGLPPWPLSRLPALAALRGLPHEEHWRDLRIFRPRFPAIPKLGGLLNVGLMTRAIWPLIRDLHAQQPFDVIDASFFFPDGPVAMRLARKLGIPFSIKARGSDIHVWGARRDTAPQLRAAGEAADGLLAVSEALKSAMVAMGLPGDKIRVHYTGVDLDRFRPGDREAARARLNLADVRGPVILCVGTLSERKGQRLVLEALGDFPDAYLLLAGEGPDGGALARLARAQRIADRVGLLGSVPHQHLPDLYNAADVMVLPSVSEGLANAWVESLACGTPIVIPDVGGAPEVVRDASAGRIVARTPAAISQGIAELLARPPDRDAVRSAAQRFTWTANGDALLDHLTGLVARASARA